VVGGQHLSHNAIISHRFCIVLYNVSAGRIFLLEGYSSHRKAKAKEQFTLLYRSTRLVNSPSSFNSLNSLFLPSWVHFFHPSIIGFRGVHLLAQLNQSVSFFQYVVGFYQALKPPHHLMGKGINKAILKGRGL